MHAVTAPRSLLLALKEEGHKMETAVKAASAIRPSVLMEQTAESIITAWYVKARAPRHRQLKPLGLPATSNRLEGIPNGPST